MFTFEPHAGCFATEDGVSVVVPDRRHGLRHMLRIGLRDAGVDRRLCSAPEAGRERGNARGLRITAAAGT